MPDQSSLTESFSNKHNIVVWGCGLNGKKLFNQFPGLAERTIGFVDSDVLRIGEQFLNKWEIKNPDFLDPNIHNVIITPRSSEEIVEYLEAKGFVYTENCIFYKDLVENKASIDSAIINNYIKRYKEAHSEVCFLKLLLPRFPKQYLSTNERYIIDNKIEHWIVRNNPIAAPVLSKYFLCPEEILEAIMPPKSYYDVYGMRKFENTQGKIVNTSNGHRITIDQPEKHKRTIFVTGGCMVFGTGSSDKGTISSHLQRLFNEFALEHEIIVENYGYYLWNGENDEENKTCSQDIINIIESLPIKSGDIILCPNFSGYYDVDLSKAATHPHNYGDVFWDNAHYTEDGNRLIADKIFEYLKANDFFNGNDTVKLPETTLSDNSGLRIADENTRVKLKAYKNEISKYKLRIGAIVMNCNPFTFGHRYLIEQAASQVTQIFIFVVQEDKSFFPFEDRLALVKEGIKDLPNVTVIPSGQFIISALTFTEYFNKSELQDRTIDSSMDVNIFGKEIAPCLDIKVRFIGEEPFDMVTKQYNETIKAVLPRYGIEVVEIPRKEQDGEAISASRVRALLEEKKFDEIAKLVPQTTLNYLEGKFG